MFDKIQHKTVLVKILKEIYSNKDLRTTMGFKGGTAAYLFYGLPRLSVDLDFDLLDTNKRNIVFKSIRKILSNFGKLSEAIEKRNTIFFLLNYEKGERNIKIEISTRLSKSQFEVKSYLGISVVVMKKEELAASKLVALLTRVKFASRDLFDLWFFLEQDWRINEKAVEEKTGFSFREAITEAIKKVEAVKTSSLLHGLGELVEEEQKKWIRTNLKKELIFLLRLYLEAQ